MEILCTNVDVDVDVDVDKGSYFQKVGIGNWVQFIWIKRTKLFIDDSFCYFVSTVSRSFVSNQLS